MLDQKEIIKIAEARLIDTKVLLSNKRFDGAVYLCGYAVELGLKSSICKTLGLCGFPETKTELKKYPKLWTHDLDELLKLSGIEAKVKKSYLAEWSLVSQWRPELRYQPIGNISEIDAKQMLIAVNNLLKIL
jgi:HEPN domain-containing protein